MVAASTLRHHLADRNPFPPRSPVEEHVDMLEYLSQIFGGVDLLDEKTLETYTIVQALKEAQIFTFEDLVQLTYEDIENLTYHYKFEVTIKKGRKRGQKKLKDWRKRNVPTQH